MIMKKNPLIRLPQSTKEKRLPSALKKKYRNKKKVGTVYLDLVWREWKFFSRPPLTDRKGSFPLWTSSVNVT